LEKTSKEYKAYKASFIIKTTIIPRVGNAFKMHSKCIQIIKLSQQQHSNKETNKHSGSEKKSVTNA